MATLTPVDLAELRQDVAAASTSVGHTKPQVNAALQSIEDWFEASRPSIAAAIEAAAPTIFSAAVKRRLVKYWLRQKFGRE